MSHIEPEKRDLADIGPEDLWGVWFKVPQFLQDAGEYPVVFKWLLASPGEKGVKEISGPRGITKGLVAALPLSALRQAGLSFPASSSSKLPPWVQAALGSSPAFRLVRNDGGEMRILQSGENVSRNEKILVQGEMDDFTQLLDEGERILVNKEWRLVFDDVRAHAQEGPVKWFSHQRTPSAAKQAETFLAEKSQ